LKAAGLDPVEDEKSWISKASKQAHRIVRAGILENERRGFRYGSIAPGSRTRPKNSILLNSSHGGRLIFSARLHFFSKYF
jgi:hypothetical protein